MKKVEKGMNEVRLARVKVTNLSGNTVVGGAWAASPAGLTISAQTFNTSSISALVGGGAVGTIYDLEGLATLSNGEIIAGHFQLEVID